MNPWASAFDRFRHLFDLPRYGRWRVDPLALPTPLDEVDLPAEFPAPTPDERAHITRVLRLYVAVQRVGRADGLASAPAPVRALAAGRFVSTRGLWLVGLWCGLLPRDLMRAARRACGEGRS